MEEISLTDEHAKRLISVNSSILGHFHFSAAVSQGWIVAFLLAWLGSSQLLLWRFLDIAPALAFALGGLVIAGLCVFTVKTTKDSRSIGMGTLMTCFLVALGLLLLSGEGRFFYANVDWQVRFAVLRDMGINPWPFVYTTRPDPDLRRSVCFWCPRWSSKPWGRARRTSHCWCRMRRLSLFCSHWEASCSPIGVHA